MKAEKIERQEKKYFDEIGISIIYENDFNEAEEQMAEVNNDGEDYFSYAEDCVKEIERSEYLNMLKNVESEPMVSFLTSDGVLHSWQESNLY